MEEIEIANRYDSIPLETKFDSTPEGFLQGVAVVTRTGVFPYAMTDGSIRWELRHPDDVFHTDSLETYKLKPITNDHPKVGLVKANNSKDFVVGSTGSEVTHDSRLVAIPLVVHNDKAIADVNNGKRELSCGYTCDVIKEDGFWEGQQYTHRQKNIKVNHIAVVRQGRAGRVARIRLDGALAPVDIENVKEIVMDEQKTIQLDSVDYKADAAVIESLLTHKKQAEELQTKLDSATETISKLEAEKDSAKERADALDKELVALKACHVDAAEVQAIIKKRVALEAFAKEQEIEIKGDESDEAIKKAVILKVFPDVVQEKLDSAVYLDARYDIACEEIAKQKKIKEESAVRSVVAEKADSKDKPQEKSYEQVRKEYVERLQNAHKRK